MAGAKKVPTIKELEGLRGILAMWVVVGHWATTIGLSLRPLRQDLWNVQAVDVFIILSGFVITLLLCTSREPYGKYLVRRFFRIWPSFAVVLVIALAMLPYTADILQAAPPSAMKEVRLAIVAESQDNYFSNILSHITLLHGLIPLNLSQYSAYAFVGQAWSISLEWQFYILAPAFLFMLRRISSLIFLISFCAAVILLTLPGEYFGAAYIGNKLYLFGVGAASFYIWQKTVENNRFPSITLMRLFTAIAAIGFIATRKDEFIGLALWIFVFHIVLNAQNQSQTGSATPEAMLARLLRNSVVLFLGRISYTLYLIHFAVLLALVGILEKFNLAPISFAAYLLFLLLPISVAAAYLLSIYVEQPFMRLGRRFAQKKPVDPAVISPS